MTFIQILYLGKRKVKVQIFPIIKKERLPSGSKGLDLKIVKVYS